MLALLQEALFHLEYQHQILKQLNAVSPFLEDKFKVFMFKITRGIMEELQMTVDKNKEEKMSDLFFIPQQPSKVRLIPANSTDKQSNHIPLNLAPRLELHNSKLKSFEQEIGCQPDMNLEETEVEETTVDDNLEVDDEDVPKEVANVESNENATVVPAENENTDHMDTNEQYDEYLEDLENYDYEEEDIKLDRNDSMFDPDDLEEEEEEKEISKPTAKPRKKKECDICGIHVIDLKKHLEVHSGVTYNCDLCQKSCSTIAGFREHVKSHGERQHECNICQKKFVRKGTLQTHAFTHGVEVQCELCGLKFNHEKRYEVHMITHRGEKEHKCNECGKEFYHRSYLTRHIKVVHQNTADYPCDYCAKMFRSKESLKIHTYIHTGHKRFVCEVCGKRFIQKIELQLHGKQHSATKTKAKQQHGKSQRSASGRKLIPSIKASL